MHVALGDRHEPVRPARRELGRPDRVGQRLGRLPVGHLGAALAGERDQAVLGAAGGDRRLGNDLQQTVPVEAGGERLADPADGPVDLHLLASQLIHLRDELVAHLVELGREAGHLVAARCR